MVETLIKEPAGVDFIIKSTPLTDKDRREINAFIVTYRVVVPRL